MSCRSCAAGCAQQLQLRELYFLACCGSMVGSVRGVLQPGGCCHAFTAYLSKQLLLVLAPQLVCLDLRCGSTAAAANSW